MDDRDNERLLRLEQRVAHIEARLALSPATAEPPLASSAPLAPAPAAAAPTPDSASPTEPPAAPPPILASTASTPKPPATRGAEPPPLPSPPPTPLAPSFASTVPPPGTEAAAAADTLPPPPPPQRFDYERFFGLAVLGRIGIAAVVLAGGYFAQLGWGQLGPTARVATLYVVSLLLVGLGAVLRPRVATRYIALLWGGATALSYLAGVTARLRYDLIGPLPALALLVASTALGQRLAHQLRMQTMATVALALGYAAPLLVGVDTGSPTSFFVYLAGLHTWAAITERLWQWHWTRGIAVAATSMLGLGWLAVHPALSPWSLVLHCNGLWLALVAPELLAAFVRAERDGPRHHAVVASAWLLQTTLLVLMFANASLPAYGVATGGVLLLLGAALRQTNAATATFGAQFAQLGGTLAVVGAFAWSADGGVLRPVVANPVASMAAVVGAAAAAAALRRWTGAADLALALAALLGLAIELDATGQSHWLAFLPLAPAVLLVARGGLLLARGTGLTLGAILAFVAVRLDQSFAPPMLFWLPIAAGATGLWLAAVAELANRRRDAALHELAAGALLGAPAFLAVLAFAALPVALDGGNAIATVPTAGLLTGALALGGAALLARHGDAVRRAAMALADFAGGLIVVGALAAWNARSAADAVGFDQPWPRLLSMTAAALLVLALRRWTAGGDLAVLLAAVLAAALTVLPEPSWPLRAQTAAWLVLPAALVLVGRAAWLRCTGLALASTALFFAATHEVSFAQDDGLWLSIAFGGSGGAAALGALRAGWRSDRALLGTATALLVALGVVWSIAALEPLPPGSQGLPAFVNLRFVSALALTALLEFGRRRLPATAGTVERATFAAIELAVVYLAGLVEMLAVVRDWPEGWSAVTISLYTLLFAGALLAAGFVRKQSWLRWPGLCGFAIVVVKVTLFDLSGLGTPLRVLAAGVLGVVLLASAYAYARVRGPASRAP